MNVKRCYASIKTKTPLVGAPQTCLRPGKHKGLCAQHSRALSVVEPVVASDEFSEGNQLGAGCDEAYLDPSCEEAP